MVSQNPPLSRRQRFLTPSRREFYREVIGRPEVLQTVVDLGVLGGGLYVTKRLGAKGMQRRVRLAVRTAMRSPKLAERRGIARELLAYRKRVGPKERRYLAEVGFTRAGRHPVTGQANRMRPSEAMLEHAKILPGDPRAVTGAIPPLKKRVFRRRGRGKKWRLEGWR